MTLPAIGNQMARVSSNIEIRGAKKPNPDQIHDFGQINKYPARNGAQQVTTSMRMSMNNINNFGSGLRIEQRNAGVNNFGNRGSQASSVYEGGILQPGASSIADTAGSSLYPDSPRLPQTVVRIRGKNNQTIETRGSLVMTLDEERKAAERRRQIKRSNERLRMLENMERERQDKIDFEIMRLNHEKARLLEIDST